MPNESLAQQLSELRKTTFGLVPQLRHVTQSFLPSRIHSEENRVAARTRVLDWARSKWPALVPAAAYEGHAFEHDQAGLRIAATSSADGSLWAFRSEHLDTQVARVWVTEAIVASLGQTDTFGVRNSCSILTKDPIPVSSPRFLKDFVSHHDLVDAGVSVTGTHYFIDDSSCMDYLVNLLTAPERMLPVIVLSQLPNSSFYAVDPKHLARDVQGLAHVFCVPPAMTFELSARVGKPLSVFNGAVRTYQPGFSTDDDPWQHHLVLPQRISEWSDEFGVGAGGFEQFLTRQIHAFSVGTHDRIDQLPSYFSIRRALLEKPNKTVDEEIHSLQLDLELSRQSEKDWQAQALESDQEARAYQGEVMGLREQVLQLKNELKELRQARWGASIPSPTNYGDIPEWISSNFADRLVLHSRALRSLKDAAFEDIGLVCKSLKLLASAYWTLRTNHEPSQHQALLAAWEDGVRQLHLDYSPNVFGSNGHGSFKAEYTIEYRIGNTTQQTLGPHLKFGTSKDQRFCMRIYFLWDEERQVVLIGSLPAHLETRAT